ncbi:MAG TPA: GMC family oxidoreductase [Steroidobacteraceae bacterium]|nr:GMC family oxidoreductase [Steroidobacteraceae bacterium]
MSDAELELTDPQEIQRTLWDVIVIGSGIGGGTLALALASGGARVLVIERGGYVAAAAGSAEGVSPDERMRNGWWPQPISRHGGRDGSVERIFAPVGCAVGGSSVHYAAALERMEPSDFEPLTESPHPVERWPIGFQEFSRCYEAAESVYGLARAGQADAEARLSPWDLRLMEAMRRNGLRPDILHVAMSYDAECRECVGRICPRGCKMDARTACVDKAARDHGCRVLSGCEVLSLEADAKRVRTVRCSREGRQLELQARVVALCAGAFHSPQILLRSWNALWPSGLANRSDQVGRNLMFHTADIYALWAPRRIDRHGRQKKALSIRDFYVHEGRRLGYVQSMGLEAGRGDIAAYLKNALRQRGLSNELVLKLVVKLPSMAAAALLGSAGIFAAMTEDDPDPGNRVVLDPAEPDGISFAYAITDDLRRRAAELRRQFARHIRPWRLVALSTQLGMNYGHPTGTCRFGDDAATSVLDRFCRAHEVENLYVVDSSFMPRSGAVNPSLTIAANALRVAPKILEQLRATGRA